LILVNPSSVLTSNHLFNQAELFHFNRRMKPES
jgi:hypothetical protein